MSVAVHACVASGQLTFEALQSRLKTFAPQETNIELIWTSRMEIWCSVFLLLQVIFWGYRSARENCQFEGEVPCKTSFRCIASGLGPSPTFEGSRPVLTSGVDQMQVPKNLVRTLRTVWFKETFEKKNRHYPQFIAQTLIATPGCIFDHILSI